MQERFRVIVVGGGHAGVEAAWAAANLLPRDPSGDGGVWGGPEVALVTLDPDKTGVMSCNPAIGGLAKGQLVREIDAMGGLMGLAADATGIQFKILNTSKGPAVHGPRAQCDKHAYAEAIQKLVHARDEIQVIGGAVDDVLVEDGRVVGVRISPSSRISPPTEESRDAAPYANPLAVPKAQTDLFADAVVLTTGTFMRGLMHTGEQQTEGGRVGEGAAVGISASLERLGFELARLKTGTPPRLDRTTIDWDALEPAVGDERPTPFSDLTAPAGIGGIDGWDRFPLIDQVECRVSHTSAPAHDAIRENLHRAPIFSGQIESTGPRYCPSIEDKIVRFGDRDAHHIFLEPESLRDDWIYCNGISTSLPADVQDRIVRAMTGCADATILRYGYAVEYDVVLSHQIRASGMTKSIRGLFLAGQINGTSGYEEAAAQGLIAGINAARLSIGADEVTLGRDQAYIGVLMDDLVTKTPVEPYRMFTSRAEHRLILRADNAPDRLTPIAADLGLLDSTELGRRRRADFERRTEQIEGLRRRMASARPVNGKKLPDLCRQNGFTHKDLLRWTEDDGQRFDERVVFSVHTGERYASYIARAQSEIQRARQTERRRIPESLDFTTLDTLRNEAREALQKFQPATIGQAARLEGITPADITLLAILITKHNERRAPVRSAE